MSTLKGAEIAEQARELGWRRDTGYSQLFRMRGVKVWIYNQLPFWQQTSDEVRITEDSSPYATLEARVNTVLDGRTEQPINVWELIGQDLNHDLYEHPKAAALTTDEVRLLRKAVDEIKRGSTITVSLGGSTSISMKDLLIKGTDAYIQSQWVLRKSQTITSKFALNLSTYAVDAIWSLEQIYAVETVYDNIANTINTIAAPAPKAGFKWGWLKKSPTIMAEANNRIKVTQEWWLEQWSTFIYLSLF